MNDGARHLDAAHADRLHHDPAAARCVNAGALVGLPHLAVSVRAGLSLARAAERLDPARTPATGNGAADLSVLGWRA